MAKNLWAQRFDPERIFVVRRPFTVAGVKFKVGDFFDKTLVTVRRLRQMYDQRRIMTNEAYEVHVLRGRRGPPSMEDASGGNPTGDPSNVDAGSRASDGGADLFETPDGSAGEGGGSEDETKSSEDDIKEIPASWHEFHTDEMKDFAKWLLGETYSTKREAEEAVKQEIKRRGELS